MVKSLIVWEGDLDGGLDMIDTPSDKLFFCVHVAKMSAEFWEKTLLAVRVSCYLAAGEVVFRL